jgi:hypothetical protein
MKSRTDGAGAGDEDREPSGEEDGPELAKGLLKVCERWPRPLFAGEDDAVAA